MAGTDRGEVQGLQNDLRLRRTATERVFSWAFFRVLRARRTGSSGLFDVVVEWRSLALRQRSHRAQEGGCGIRERPLSSMDEPQNALHFQLGDRNGNQSPRFEFARNREVRDQGHAISRGDEALDGLDGG